MNDTLRTLLARLRVDPWRQQRQAFSGDLVDAQHQILSAATVPQVTAVLASWLERYQPCLFGRIAAKRGLLSYCILDEEDFALGDAAVRDKIQAHRLRWTAETHYGLKSGFVILVRSERISTARPTAPLLALAQRLASLYLLEDVKPNEIYMDEVFLEAPGTPPMTWKWLAGVNVFAPQADGRWWHDHRIPGGLAFSVNSVGHLVKSGLLAKAMMDLHAKLGVDDAGDPPAIVDSLPKALDLAMRTISLAAATPWGRATELVELSDEMRRADTPACPVELPEFLRGKSHCQYAGWYHTDQTLPREYFRSSASRPVSQSRRLLDFTYLYDDKIDNPDYRRLGAGVRIRSTGFDALAAAGHKRRKTSPVKMNASSSARLALALRTFPRSQL